MIISFILSLALFFGSLGPENTSQTPPLPIPIGGKSNGDQGNVPRMPAHVPIQGTVFGDTIYLSFSAGLEMISNIHH